MGEACWGQLYVDAVFSSESKVAMQHLVENLSVALKARLEGLPWMKEDTQEEGAGEVGQLHPEDGYLTSGVISRA